MFHEPVAECVTEPDAGPDSGDRADQGDDRRLPGDHAPDLTGRGGHRAQQRDLAFALLDGQAHGASHNEHRNEQREPAECSGDRDQGGARLLELRILGPPTPVAGEHLGAAGDRAQARDVDTGRAEHADRVDPPRMAGQSGRFGVGKEDRGLLGDWMAGTSDTDDCDCVGGIRGRQGQPHTERDGIAGDDLVGPGGWPSGTQDIGRQHRTTPRMGDGRLGSDPNGHGHVTDRGADPGDGREPSAEPGAHPGAFAELYIVVGADRLLAGYDSRGGGVALHGRLRTQDRLELHTPGHRDHGGREEGEQRTGERGEAAASAENGET